jgi:hypothetical protein
MSKEEKPQVIVDYPDLENIDLSDIEVQKDLIKLGICVGMPGGELIFVQSVEIVAGGKKS